MAADNRCRLHDWDHVGAGAQPGEQRLIQRLRDPCLTETIDYLFDIERHPVATPSHSGSITLGQSRFEGHDQLIGLLVGQGIQVDHFDRPRVRQQPPGRPVSTASSRPELALAASRAPEGDVSNQCTSSATSSPAPRPHTPADNRAPPRRSAHRACGPQRAPAHSHARRDPQDRRQQRHHTRWMQPAGPHLGVQQPQPFGLLGEAADATPALQ